MCVAIPNGETNRLCEDLAAHLALDHARCDTKIGLIFRKWFDGLENELYAFALIRLLCVTPLLCSAVSVHVDI